REGFEDQSRNPGSAFGEFSRVWTYRRGPNAAVLSLDYPFPAWHDLTRCYTGLGWQIGGEAVHPAGAPESGPGGGYVELALTRPGYRAGSLLFCQFNPDGVPLEPRRGGAHLSVHRHESALRRWLGQLDGAGAAPRADPRGPVYQLQLFVESYAPLSRAEQ